VHPLQTAVSHIFGFIPNAAAMNHLQVIKILEEKRHLGPTQEKNIPLYSIFA